jgi:hypothetical protein
MKKESIQSSFSLSRDSRLLSLVVDFGGDEEDNMFIGFELGIFGDPSGDDIGEVVAETVDDLPAELI